MKKVLALVLAVIMVCTMAMAVTINDGGDSAYNPGTTTTPVSQIKPGAKIYFDLEDISDGNFYVNKDDEFVPANNVVTVTYGKGADLVKSAGWVQVDEDKTEATSWQYQIVLKDSDTATFDGKAVDFSITKVTFKATGELLKTYLFDGKDGNEAKYERDYGWATDEVMLDASGKAEIVGFNTKFDLEKIYTLTATTDDEGKTVSENVWTLTNGTNAAKFTVKAGQKVLRKDLDVDTDALETKYGYDENNELATLTNDTNLVGTASVLRWTSKMNVYAVALDGTVSKVAVTVDDGVASFTVPAYSAVAVYEGTLQNVTTTTGTGTTTDTTTNPGTGANDVVGVAAALAVIALVSGAAISLKK